MIRRRLNTHGFTLLESLVALAIATVVINGFYGALSTGTLLQGRADLQAERMLVAAGVLDRVGIDLPLRSGTVLSDTTRGHAWELIVTPQPPVDMAAAAQPGLLFVSVAVSDPDGTSDPVVLRAIRYAESPL